MVKMMWMLLIWLKKVDLLSEKKHIQTQSLVPTTTPVQEQLPHHSSQMQLLTITMKIGDSFEGNGEVEDDIQGAIVEVDKKET